MPYEIAVDRAWAHAIERRNLHAGRSAEIICSARCQLNSAQGEPAWLDASAAEDVHHFVEMALIEKLGPLGAKLHTGRSRNELIATDFRLFVRDAAARNLRARRAAGIALARSSRAQYRRCHARHDAHAARPADSIFAFPAGAPEAFIAIPRESPRRRTRRCVPDGIRRAGRMRVSNRSRSACPRIGFARATANSLDAVSDRDFALEYLFALAVLGTHLSRLAEDFVLFASQEFGFIALPDEYATGSSLMPQKKNPDSWELTRGKTGRLFGALMSLLVTMKGFPTSYQRDLQEDKEPVFAAHDQALALVEVAAGAIAATQINASAHARSAPILRYWQPMQPTISCARRAIPPRARNHRKSFARGGTHAASRGPRRRSSNCANFLPTLAKIFMPL